MIRLDAITIIIGKETSLQSPKVIPDIFKSVRIAQAVTRVCSIPLIAAMLGAASVHAIVSDRHLQGVSALECDLESSQAEFRMLVNAKKHTLQLENTTQTITYQEISEDTMRFALVLPEAPMRICELQFPAGALVCTSDDGQADLGFCLTL